MTKNGYNIMVDAGGDGWGACLLWGNKIIRCVSGLWKESFKFHKSNDLEFRRIVLSNESI